MARGVIDLPYTRQFIGTLPYLYPIYQAVVWSLGVPLGLAGFGAALAVLVDALRTWARRQWQRLGELSLPLAWFLVYFGINSAPGDPIGNLVSFEQLAESTPEEIDAILDAIDTAHFCPQLLVLTPRTPDR